MSESMSRSSVSVRHGSPALVGRTGELRTVLSVLGQAPSVVFLGGEAGVGKSRLVAEVLRRQPVSRWTAVAACQPLHEPFPYGPVLECLRGCGERLRVPGGLSPLAGELTPWLPELAGILPPAPTDSGDPASRRHRLFRAVRELIGAAGPALLVIEDAQWADEGSRALLRFLLSDPPGGLNMLLTYRTEDLAVAGGALGRSCPTAAGVAVARVVLSPLDATEVRLMAEEALGGPLSPECGELLRERTGGLPFVLEEVLHALLEEPVCTDHRTSAMQRTLETMAPPASVAEAMVERLAALSPEARGIAHAAAVLDGPTTADALGAVSGLPKGRQVDAMVEALAANVLVETGSGRYGFRHSFARQAVYRSLPGPARARTHVRAVRALRALPVPPLVELAEHSRRAGRHTDWSHYGELAADRFASSADAPAAIALLHRLLDGPIKPADVDRLALKLSRIASAGLDQHEVAETLQRLLSDNRLSDAVKGEIRLGLGLLLIRQENCQQTARDELARAIGELRDKPELAARGMGVLALSFLGTAPLSETEPWMREVERIIDTGERPWRTSLLAGVLGSRLHTGDPGVWRRIELLPTSVDTMEERRELARAQLNLADACSWIGHYTRARQFLRTGLQLATGSGSPYIESTGRATELRLDWHAGAWTGLEERTLELLETYAGLAPITAEMSLVLARLAAARGDWDRMESAIEHTGIGSPANSVAPVVIAASATVARTLLARGELDQALAAAERGLDLIRRKGIWAWAGELAPIATRALCMAGRFADADALIAELRTGVEGRDAPLASAAVYRCLAESAEQRDDPRTARELYGLCRERYAGLGMTYSGFLLAERDALCALRLSDPSAADLLSALADSFEELGASRDAARCRHTLREHGTVSSSRRGRRGYGGELSPREHDVAALLASGRSNREIAEALFLSRRTVEQHVASVLRKLGRSRRELTADPGHALTPQIT